MSQHKLRVDRAARLSRNRFGLRVEGFQYLGIFEADARRGLGSCEITALRTTIFSDPGDKQPQAQQLLSRHCSSGKGGLCAKAGGS